MTEITWNELTTDEREALQALAVIGGTNDPDSNLDYVYAALDKRGLVSFLPVDCIVSITDAGRAVLAQKPTAKTVKLRVPSADGLYWEVLYTDGTWEGEVHGEQ